MRYITILLLVLIGLIILAKGAIAQPPDTQLELITSVEPIVFEEAVADDPRTYAIAMAREYGLSDKVTEEMLTTIDCESGFNPKAYNGLDKHANSIGSHGISQFSMETVKGWGKEIGIDDPDPYDYKPALEVMAYAFSQGEKYKDDWSCWKKFYK